MLKQFIRLLHWLTLFVLFVMTCQGKGSLSVFIAILTAVTLLRLILVKSYRRYLVDTVGKSHRELGAFYQTRAKIPYRGIFVWAVIPTLFFTLANGGSMSSMDNAATTMTAANLVLHGTPELSSLTRKPFPQSCENLEYYLMCTSKGLYSAYPLGMVTFALPVFLWARALGTDVENSTLQWRLAKWTASWIAAMCMGLFLLLALYGIPTNQALALSGIVMTGSTMLSIVGQGLWTQGGVCLGLLLVVFLECRANKIRHGHAFYTALCFAIMFACRLTSAVMILPLGLWILWRAPRRGILTAIWGILLFAPFSYFLHVTYGGWLGPQTVMSAARFWSTNLFPQLAGLLFSPARGLFIYQPWIFIGIVGLLLPKEKELRSNLPRGWEIALGAAVLFHLLLIGSWNIWFGGHTWGSRLLAELIPLVGILLARPFAKVYQHRYGKPFIVTIALFAFFTQATFVYSIAGYWADNPPKDLAPGTNRFWHWADPPFLFPFLR